MVTLRSILDEIRTFLDEKRKGNKYTMKKFDIYKKNKLVYDEVNNKWFKFNNKLIDDHEFINDDIIVILNFYFTNPIGKKFIKMFKNQIIKELDYIKTVIKVNRFNNICIVLQIDENENSKNYDKVNNKAKNKSQNNKNLRIQKLNVIFDDICIINNLDNVDISFIINHYSKNAKYISKLVDITIIAPYIVNVNKLKCVTRCILSVYNVAYVKFKDLIITLALKYLSYPEIMSCCQKVSNNMLLIEILENEEFAEYRGLEYITKNTELLKKTLDHIEKIPDYITGKIQLKYVLQDTNWYYFLKSYNKYVECDIESLYLLSKHIRDMHACKYIIKNNPWMIREILLRKDKVTMSDIKFISDFIKNTNYVIDNTTLKLLFLKFKIDHNQYILLSRLLEIM